MKTSSQMSPTKKHHRLQWRNEEKTQGDSSAENLQLIITPEKIVTVITNKVLSLTGNTKQGQPSWFSEEEVMTFKDMPIETYELSTILHHGMTYELIDFLTHLQVVAAARMAQ